MDENPYKPAQDDNEVPIAVWIRRQKTADLWIGRSCLGLSITCLLIAIAIRWLLLREDYTLFWWSIAFAVFGWYGIRRSKTPDEDFDA